MTLMITDHLRNVYLVPLLVERFCRFDRARVGSPFKFERLEEEDPALKWPVALSLLAVVPVDGGVLVGVPRGVTLGYLSEYPLSGALGSFRNPG
jgi:hypothetical protein